MIHLMPLLLFSLSCPAASSEGPGRMRTRTYHPPAISSAIEEGSFTNIDRRDDWRAWISTHYPDTSQSWPVDCAKSLQARLKEEEWEFTAKGDFTEGGAPSVMMLKTRELPRKDSMITRFSILECRQGRWSEILGLGPESRISTNGEELKGLSSAKIRGYSVGLEIGTEAAPGLQIIASGLDESGRGVTEGFDFYYLPDERQYEVIAN